MHMSKKRLRCKTFPEGLRLFGARHAESGLGQLPVAVGIDHLLDIAGDSADQVDVALFEEVVERVAHRTTDDDEDTELFDLVGTLENGFAFHWDCLAGYVPLPARFQKAQLGAGVQDR